MVQIAWLIYDSKGKLLKEKSAIIKPEWYTIPRAASSIHRVTTTRAKKEWQDLKKILKEFCKDVKKSKFLVAHNIDFDRAIIWAELFRKTIDSCFDEKKLVCTMKENTEFCGIRKWRWYKWPTLSELHYKLFDRDFEEAHDALVDTQACATCFFELQKLNNKKISTTKKPKTKKKTRKEPRKKSKKKTSKNIKTTILWKTISFDQIASQVLDDMENTDKNIFLTWKAGTWKSTLLTYFLNTTKKNIAVLAPTGVAALNVDWSTIHSFFRFPTTITEHSAQAIGRRNRSNELYSELDTIVIDEISMVRADMLDCIDAFLKSARQSDRSFGGVQMIFIWDLYQLPPIVGRNEKEFFESHYDSPYFFSANICKGSEFSLEFVELEKIYRQTDQDFVDILNAIRNKTVEENHLDLLNTRVLDGDIEIEEWCMYMTGTNKKAKFINDQQLGSLESEIFSFDAEIDGDFTMSQHPTDDILMLKVGAQIMFVANDLGWRWVNGTVGKIIEIDEYEIRIMIYGGEEVVVGEHTWEVKKYVYDNKIGKLWSKSVGSFTQIPIKLAWAITIHKSQWKTFEKAIVDLGSGVFAHGQTYVALITQFQYKKSDEKLSLDDKVEIIEQAIQDWKSLKITYLKAQDVKSKRTIEPYSVGEKHYSWKPFLGVDGFCQTRRQDRVFRVDRILEMEVVKRENKQ